MSWSKSLNGGRLLSGPRALGANSSPSHPASSYRSCTDPQGSAPRGAGTGPLRGCAPSSLNGTGQARPNPVLLGSYGAQITNLNLVLSSPVHFTSEHTEPERRVMVYAKDPVASGCPETRHGRPGSETALSNRGGFL